MLLCILSSNHLFLLSTSTNQQYRPLVWRNTHPYVVVDRHEDITHPNKTDADPHCDLGGPLLPQAQLLCRLHAPDAVVGSDTARGIREDIAEQL